jgi:acyl dehydratase
MVRSTFGNLISMSIGESPVSTADINGLTTTLAELHDCAGRHLGHSDWSEMTQELVDQFAEVTGDHNFIHVDPDRARSSPFGGTIAHGFLTLSLIAPITQQALTVTDASVGINYGLDRVRFPAPLPVGARWRAGVEVQDVREVGGGGVEVKLLVTVEVENAAKPALVAENLIRNYP